MTSNQRIALITDSTCDLPQNLLEQYNILVVPQYVIFGTEELNDLTQIDPAGFYERLRTDPHHPKTSRPTVPDFMTLIDKARSEGAEEVVTVLVSDKLSGSVGTAHQVQQEVDIPLHIYDSRTVSAGLGFQVLAAARARVEGADVAGIIAAAEDIRRRSRMWFTVDTLEYLHKGGRIGGAARWFGSALQLKPTLTINQETGEVGAGERTRTRSRALQYMSSAIFKGLEGDGALHVGVVHGDTEDDARQLADLIREKYQPETLFIESITPAIGVHGGPGVIGVGTYYG